MTAQKVNPLFVDFASMPSRRNRSREQSRNSPGRGRRDRRRRSSAGRERERRDRRRQSRQPPPAAAPPKAPPTSFAKRYALSRRPHRGDPPAKAASSSLASSSYRSRSTTVRGKASISLKMCFIAIEIFRSVLPLLIDTNALKLTLSFSVIPYR